MSVCCGYGVRGQGTGECVLWVWVRRTSVCCGYGIRGQVCAVGMGKEDKCVLWVWNKGTGVCCGYG